MGLARVCVPWVDRWRPRASESGARMSRGILAFWIGLIALVLIDFHLLAHPRVEPAPFALGSGAAPTGGHCSGK